MYFIIVTDTGYQSLIYRHEYCMKEEHFYCERRINLYFIAYFNIDTYCMLD